MLRPWKYNNVCSCFFFCPADAVVWWWGSTRPEDRYSCSLQLAARMPVWQESKVARENTTHIVGTHLSGARVRPCLERGTILLLNIYVLSERPQQQWIWVYNWWLPSSGGSVGCPQVRKAKRSTHALLLVFLVDIIITYCNNKRLISRINGIRVLLLIRTLYIILYTIARVISSRLCSHFPIERMELSASWVSTCESTATVVLISHKLVFFFFRSSQDVRWSFSALYNTYDQEEKIKKAWVSIECNNKCGNITLINSRL